MVRLVEVEEYPSVQQILSPLFCACATKNGGPRCIGLVASMTPLRSAHIGVGVADAMQLVAFPQIRG